MQVGLSGDENIFQAEEKSWARTIEFLSSFATQAILSKRHVSAFTTFFFWQLHLKQIVTPNSTLSSLKCNLKCKFAVKDALGGGVDALSKGIKGALQDVDDAASDAAVTPWTRRVSAAAATVLSLWLTH